MGWSAWCWPGTWRNREAPDTATSWNTARPALNRQDPSLQRTRRAPRFPTTDDNPPSPEPHPTAKTRKSPAARTHATTRTHPRADPPQGHNRPTTKPTPRPSPAHGGNPTQRREPDPRPEPTQRREPRPTARTSP